MSTAPDIMGRDITPGHKDQSPRARDLRTIDHLARQLDAANEIIDKLYENSGIERPYGVESPPEYVEVLLRAEDYERWRGYCMARKVKRDTNANAPTDGIGF